MPLGSGKTIAGSSVPSTTPPLVPRTRRTVIGVVLVVLLIGALTFVAVKASQEGTPPRPAAQPSASSQPPTLPPASGFAIPGCYNPSLPPFPRPIRLNIVGCASVAVALQDMSWSSWGPQGADGTGVAVFKICDPNCASGYQLTSPVVVHASNPQPPRADAGCPADLKVFADMILAFPKGAPPPTAQKMNTQYNGMPAVHYTNYSVDNSRDSQFIGYTFCT
jgi:hypothetical protein